MLYLPLSLHNSLAVIAHSNRTVYNELVSITYHHLRSWFIKLQVAELIGLCEHRAVEWCGCSWSWVLDWGGVNLMTGQYSAKYARVKRIQSVIFYSEWIPKWLLGTTNAVWMSHSIRSCICKLLFKIIPSYSQPVLIAWTSLVWSPDIADLGVPICASWGDICSSTALLIWSLGAATLVAAGNL